MTQRGRLSKDRASKAVLQDFHSALCLLIAPPDIIHLLQEFVLRSRTNTLANPLSWQSDMERDILHMHAHSSFRAQSLCSWNFWKPICFYSNNAIYATDLHVNTYMNEKAIHGDSCVSLLANTSMERQIKRQTAQIIVSTRTYMIMADSMDYS